VDLFRRVLEQKPDHEGALLARAQAYLQLGQPDNALADYTQTTGLYPRSTDAWSSLGRAYLQLRQWNGAVNALSAAIELNPEANWCADRGWARAHLGQWQQAIADYSRALDVYPKWVEVLQKRAYAYSVLAQWENAAGDLAPEGFESVPPT